MIFEAIAGSTEATSGAFCLAPLGTGDESLFLGHACLSFTQMAIASSWIHECVDDNEEDKEDDEDDEEEDEEDDEEEEA